MDQDATWYEGRPQPRPHCVCCMGTQLPLSRVAQPPNFQPMSIVAKRSPIPATAELLLLLHYSFAQDSEFYSQLLITDRESLARLPTVRSIPSPIEGAP